MSKKIKDAEIIFAEETLQDAYGPLWETMPEEKKKQLIEDFISRFRKQQQKEEKPNSEKSSEPTKKRVTARLRMGSLQMVLYSNE